MMFLTVVLLGLCCIGAASASCAQDLSKDPDYTTCAMGIAMLMQDQTSDMMTTMCSPKGQQKMECFLQYAKDCPELLTPQDGGGGGDSMGAILGQLGNMKQMCSMFSGVSGGCTSKLQQCVDTQAPGDSPEPGSTPFSMFPAMTEMVCGRLKTMFDCLEGFKGECPDQVVLMEQTMESMFASQPSSSSAGGNGYTPVINFGVLRPYITKECPKVPQGYATNTCVKQKLESRKFQTCYSKLMNDFNNQLNDCPAYFAGKKCIEESVGACGKYFARAVVQGAPVFMTDVPSNCETGMGDGSVVVKTTISYKPDYYPGSTTHVPSPASGNDDDGGAGGSGVPGFVTILTETNVPTSTIILIRWNKPTTGGSDILKYKVKYQRVEVKKELDNAMDAANGKGYELLRPIDAESVITNIRTLRFELKGLYPNTFYMITVEAKNMKGWGTPGTKIIKTANDMYGFEPTPAPTPTPTPSPASGNDDDGGAGGSGGIQASILTLIVASASLILLFH